MKCSNCGEFFNRTVYEHNRQVKNGKVRFFCSHKCAMVGCGKEKSLGLITKNCEMCGISFVTKNLNWKIKKCCSKSCANMMNKSRELDKWQSYQKINVIRKKPNGWIKGQSFTEEGEILRRKKNSIAAKLNTHGNYGGCKIGSGRGKCGWYGGYYCQSSWELAWVIYYLDHNLKFKRNVEGFEYTFENKKHRYYPDFILEDGSYVEIKGYNSIQWEEKKKQFPHTLLIIGKEEIKLYLNYTIGKYGKDFIKLYKMESKVAGSNH